MYQENGNKCRYVYLIPGDGYDSENREIWKLNDC